MTIRAQIIRQLRGSKLEGVAERVASYKEVDIWDLLPAARGLTVVMADGCVLPLPLPLGTARQLLHGWSVEAQS